MVTKRKFLNELNHELRSLKQEERIKYLNNYQEIIADKMERGMSESDVVADFGSVKQIAIEILSSYTEMEKGSVTRKAKSVNRSYMLSDIIILVFAYIFAYIVYCKSNGLQDYSLRFPFYQYISALIVLIPCYYILYYIFRLYEDKYIHKQLQEAGKIVLANFIGIMLFALLLYFTSNYFFTRAMLFHFFLTNTVMAIAARNLISSHKRIVVTRDLY